MTLNKSQRKPQAMIEGDDFIEVGGFEVTRRGRTAALIESKGDLAALIEAYPGLNELTLANWDGCDLSPLIVAKDLARLDMDGAAVETIRHLGALRNLTHVDLSRTLVTYLGPLRRMTLLNQLHLDDAPVKDLSALKGLARLHALTTPDGETHGSETADTRDARADVANAINVWSKS